MADIIKEGYTPTRIAATTTIFTGDGFLAGILCTTAGTVGVQDSGSNQIVDAISMEAGVYYPMSFALAGGCKITISGGAVVTATYLD